MQQAGGGAATLPQPSCSRLQRLPADSRRAELPWTRQAGARRPQVQREQRALSLGVWCDSN